MQNKTIAWQKLPLRNFTLKNCLFGATNIVKSCDKKLCVCIVATEQYLMEKVSGVLAMTKL